MHTNRLLSSQYTGFMRHHTWLVQSWLSIEDQNIPIAEVSIHLLVDRRCPCKETMLARGCSVAFLRREQLVRNGCSLLHS